jgi:hypothetical protein
MIIHIDGHMRPDLAVNIFYSTFVWLYRLLFVRHRFLVSAEQVKHTGM